MTTNTDTVSLKIPAQKTSPAPIDEDGVSAGENCGRWLGFWYGWWVCWWAGFLISSIPVSFTFSFLSQKLCSLILKASRKLCSCPVNLTACSSVIKHLMKQGDNDERYNAEGLSEGILKWKKQMPGIVLGTVIGVFQILNCLLRQYEVGGAIFGVIFGFVLMVVNVIVPKMWLNLHLYSH